MFGFHGGEQENGVLTEGKVLGQMSPKIRSSGDPKYFDVRIDEKGVLSFNVRCGDGSPYRVYLSPNKAEIFMSAIISESRNWT